jgi:hypothetical protein
MAAGLIENKLSLAEFINKRFCGSLFSKREVQNLAGSLKSPTNMSALFKLVNASTVGAE